MRASPRARAAIIVVVTIVLAGVVGYFMLPFLDPAGRLYDEGNKLAEEGKYAAATEKYLTIIQKYPDTNEAKYYVNDELGDCYYNWAENLRNETKYSEAVEKYEMADEYLADGFPYHIKDGIGECYYKWGQSLQGQKNYAESIDKYKAVQFSSSYEKSKEAIGECYYEWGQDLQSQKNYTGAIDKYQSSIDQTYSEYKVLSRAGISECYQLWVSSLVATKEYDEAIQTYVMILENYTTSGSEWDWTRSEGVEVLSDIPADVLFTQATNLRQEKSYDASIGLYGTLLRYYPENQYAPEAEKARIDTEIEKIAAGAHGDLPPVFPETPQQLEGKIEYTIINDTPYVLTLLLSGPTTRSITLNAGATETITLEPGAYKKAAKVSAVGVEPYYGETTFLADYLYESRFYITQG